jgi:hypothetical protein
VHDVAAIAAFLRQRGQSSPWNIRPCVLAADNGAAPKLLRNGAGDEAAERKAQTEDHSRTPRQE